MQAPRCTNACTNTLDKFRHMCLALLWVFATSAVQLCMHVQSLCPLAICILLTTLHWKSTATTSEGCVLFAV